MVVVVGKMSISLFRVRVIVPVPCVMVYVPILLLMLATIILPFSLMARPYTAL